MIHGPSGRNPTHELERGESVRMSSDFSRTGRAGVASVFLTLSIVLALLVMLPATAFGQAAATATPAAATATTTTATNPTTTAGQSLTLSTSNGLPGATITANGSGFQPNETVDVTFNGQAVGSPNVNGQGTWSLAFNVPNMAAGQYGVVAKGRATGDSASTVFTVNQTAATLNFNPAQAAPGSQLTVTGTGFKAGETVTL